ncbi:MAG: putative transposase [Paraglaciecola sp.]|jgi:putative transposase
MLIAESEGANFWLSVLTEQQHRSVEYILIACVDGLKGFHDEIDTMFSTNQCSALYRAHGAQFT